MNTIAEISTLKKPRFDKAYLTQSILSEGYTHSQDPLNFYMYAYALHMYTFYPLVTPDLPPYTMDRPLLAVPRQEQSVHHGCTWLHPGNPWNHSLLPAVKNIKSSIPGFKASNSHPNYATAFLILTCSVVFFFKVPSTKICNKNVCPLCKNSFTFTVFR